MDDNDSRAMKLFYPVVFGGFWGGWGVGPLPPPLGLGVVLPLREIHFLSVIITPPL
jgi:hypothetical protein